MSHLTARDTVLRILARAELRRIEFLIGSVPVTWKLLDRVRTCVLLRRILVNHDPKLGSTAAYDSGADVIHLGFDRIERITQEGIIVHECLHAGFDLARATKMRVSSSEAAAYVAQCLYLRQKASGPDERMYSDEPARDGVYELAWTLAGNVLAGRAISAAEWESLRQAIGRHPLYKKNAATDAGFDGVPCHRYHVRPR